MNSPLVFDMLGIIVAVNVAALVLFCLHGWRNKNGDERP
jgi:hypothetical protein